MKYLCKVFIFFIIFFNSIQIFAQSNKEKFYYSDYLADKQVKREVFKLCKEGKFEEAIALTNTLKCKSYLCKDKYKLMALCYYKLKDSVESRKNLILALNNGASLSELKYNYLGIDYKIDSFMFEEEFGKYRRSINLEERKYLFYLYFSDISYDKKIDIFDSLINSSGWDGITRIGLKNACNVTIYPKRNLDFIYMMPQKQIQSYFELIFNECENFNEDWNEFESLIRNIMIREVQNGGIANMYTLFDSNNVINKEKLLLQLSIIATYIQDKYCKVTFYKTDKLPLNKWEELIPQINNILRELDITQSLINYSETAIESNQSITPVVFTYNYFD